MKDGHEYVLARVCETLRVQWHDFKINGVAVDADIALAATAPFAKARASLGQDFVTAQDIGTVLQDSLSIALTPFSGRMPKQYSTFPRQNLLEIQSHDIEPALPVISILSASRRHPNSKPLSWYLSSATLDNGR